MGLTTGSLPHPPPAPSSSSSSAAAPPSTTTTKKTTTNKLWISSSSSSSSSGLAPLLPHLRMAVLCASLPSFVVFFFFFFNSRSATTMTPKTTTLVVLHAHYQVVALICVTSLLTLAAMVWRRGAKNRCYLLDFCCTGAEGNICASEENFRYFLGTWKGVKESNLEFQYKVLGRSGVGGEAYAPPRLIEMGEESSLADARVETENLVAAAAARLLGKLGMDPKDVDILVLNSSLFNPVPSLTAFVVNRLRMRSNVRSFNLAGMGCSAGLVSIGLARDLLRARRRGGLALVISTENITRNMYYGNDRSFMVSNCLFRCGCAAVLLSSRPRDRRAAKLELVRCLRTNMGADQDAYESVHHMEDAEGKLGVRLQMSLVEVAGKALRANIVQLAPSILPVREIVKVALDLARRKLFVLRGGGGGGDNKSGRRPPAYEPDFKQAIDHFCIHPGGRAVIASIGKGLKLDSYHIEPGKMALHRFGNTSSSGIWYALAYCEAQGRLKKGHKVWQIALGSGFKCNSGVWRVLRDIDPVADDAPHGCNPWLSCIHRYPVLVSDTASASASAPASASQEEEQRSSSSSSSLNLPQPPPPPSSSMATPATTSG